MAVKAPKVPPAAEIRVTPERVRIPAAPKGVGTQGKKLWREVLSEHELSQAELSILTAACRCITTLERIAEELESGALTSLNARGDLVSSPLVVEQRQQSATLTRLIASLRLPEDNSDDRPQRRGAARGSYGLRVLR